MGDRRQRLMMFFHSIRFKLVLWFVAILGVVLGVFSTFLYMRQAQDLRGIASRTASFKVSRLVGFFRLREAESILLNPSAPEEGPSRDPLLAETDVLALFSMDGELIQNWGEVEPSSLTELATQAQAQLETMLQGMPAPATDETHTDDKEGQPQFMPEGREPQPVVEKRLTLLNASGQSVDYVLVHAPILSDNEVLGFLLLGTPVDPDGQLPRLVISLVAGNVLMLTIALGGGVWLADRAMHPVKVITQAARKIGETDLSLRLNLKSKDELGLLAETFDEMLARLQAAFERQRQFTADASHELRTPLTIVELETSRVLESRHSADEYEEALKTIHSENQFMIRLVSNLLVLARMDAGQVALRLEELDLGDLALDVVERLEPLAARGAVQLTTGDLPEILVRGDRQYLIQMMTNLVENAIKYTRCEQPRVHVEVGLREDESGKWAWFRVVDNGPGIAPEHIPHLFDRFYRADKARTRGMDPEDDSSGTGLGLAISQWVAVAHGGRITASSEVGQGAAFEAMLPLE